MKSYITVCRTNHTLDVFDIEVDDSYDIKQDKGLTLKKWIVRMHKPTERVTGIPLKPEQIDIVAATDKEISMINVCKRMNYASASILKRISEKDFPYTILYVTDISDENGRLPQIGGILATRVMPDRLEKVSQKYNSELHYYFEEYGVSLSEELPHYDGLRFYNSYEFNVHRFETEGYFVVNGRFFADKTYGRSDSCALFLLGNRKSCGGSCENCKQYMCTSDAIYMIKKYIEHKSESDNHADAAKVNEILRELGSQYTAGDIMQYLPDGNAPMDVLRAAVSEALNLLADKKFREMADELLKNPNSLPKYDPLDNNLKASYKGGALILRGSKTGDLTLQIPAYSAKDLVRTLLDENTEDSVVYVMDYGIRKFKAMPGHLKLGVVSKAGYTGIYGWDSGSRGPSATSELVAVLREI